MKKKIVLIAALLILMYGMFAVWNDRASAPSSSEKVSAPTVTNTPAQPAFDKTTYSISDPTSLWVIINKVSTLPSDYVPADLTAVAQGEAMRAQAATALAALLTAAQTSGNNMYNISGYRSYQTQVATYNAYVKSDGQKNADTYSARAGHSEHQTGLAMDLGNATCDLQICFGDTAGGKWLAAHAHEYGFVVRYQKGKEMITGYQYEPWHIRYVGVELAAELQKTGQTMEEFFGVVPPTQPY